MPVSHQEPYLGPRPFESREDAGRFFGRKRESRDLLSLVIADSEVLVFAQSGAGKTSLLNAGLIALLEQRGFEILPTARPRGQVSEEIAAEEIPNIFVFNTLIRWAGHKLASPDLIHLTLAGFLRSLERTRDDEGSPALRVIIFDQFEELFTSHPERAADRKGFFEQVRDALRADSRLRAVFAMREEYLAELEPYASMLPGGLRTRYRLERLRAPAALEAVTGPLAGSEVSFAPGVAENLVDELLKVKIADASGGSRVIPGEYVEPVQLQVVCQNLWRNLPKEVTKITDQHRQAYGDASRALEQFYRRCLVETTRASGVHERRLRKWFNDVLITPAGTRNAVWMGRSETGGLGNKAVRKLVELHLVRGEERQGRGHWYELTHDRMVEPVQASNQIWRRQRRKLWQRSSILAAIAATLVLGVFSCIEVQKSQSHLLRAEQALAEANEVEKLITEANRRPVEAVDKLNKAIKKYPRNANLYNALGIAYRDGGNESEAINAFKESIQLDPTFPYPYGNLADIYLKQKDYTNAIATYEKAIRLAPDEEYPVHGLAYVYRSLSNYPAVLQVYKNAVALNLKNAVFHAALADEYWRQTNYSAAIAGYEQAIKSDAENASYYARLATLHQVQTNYAVAIANYEEAIRLGPRDKYSVDGLASVYRSLGDYENALRVYKEAVDSNAMNAVLHAALADEYLNQTNYPAAVGTYEQAIQLDASNATYYARLGRAYWYQSNYVEAIVNYQRATNLVSTDSSYHADLGALYWSQGYLTNAIAQYQKAVNLAPKRIAFRRNLAEVFVLAERMDEAIAEFKYGIELDKKETSLHLRLGETYADLGRYAEATDSYAEAAKLEPKSSEPYRGLARVYSDTGHRDKAIATVNLAIELEPNNATNYQSLGQIHLDYKEFSDALFPFTRATDLDPTNSSLWFDLGNAYWFLKRTNESKQAFLRARTNNQDNPDAYNGLGYVYLLMEDWTNAAAQFEQVVFLASNAYQGYFNLGLVRALEGKAGEARLRWEDGLKRCRPTSLYKQLNRALFQIALGRTADEAEPGLVELRKLLADNRPPGLLQVALADAELLGKSPLKLPGIELAIKELRQAMDRAPEKRPNAL